MAKPKLEEVIDPNMERSTTDMVQEFHAAFGQEDALVPTTFHPTPHQADELEDIAAQLKRISERCKSLAKENPDNKAFIRLHLIVEETGELAEAFGQDDLVEVADALTDIQYVLDGSYLATGFAPIKQQMFCEVQRANMSKLGEDGKPVLDPGSGRVLKGPNYIAPDLSGLVWAFHGEQLAAHPPVEKPAPEDDGMTEAERIADAQEKELQVGKYAPKKEEPEEKDPSVGNGFGAAGERKIADAGKKGE